MNRDNSAASTGGNPGTGGAGAAPKSGRAADELRLKAADFDAFERLLNDVQTAFGREDYAALRQLTTPEMVSYLSEELSENATRGQRNDVSDVKLLQGDLAESWREGDVEFATVAMRYESRDVMRDRASGAIVSGDPERATETTEIWTFIRRGRGVWQLSAIQEA